MRRTVVLTLLAALVVVPAVAVAGSSVAGANSQTFPDSTGEDPAGPDVTSVAVSNDDGGQITFRINISNRPALTPDMVLLLYIDSVQGAGDTESFGADYALQLIPAGVGLFQWNGSDYLAAPSQASVSSSYATTGATLQVSKADIGNPKAINFVVFAISGLTEDSNGDTDFTNSHADLAPDRGRGTYSYQVLTTFSLNAVGFTTTPKPPRAGKSFSVGLAVTQSDTKSFVQQGQIACRATIGGQAVPLKARRLVNGVAVCVWPIPKTATGKTVRGVIALTVEGARVKKSFSARIS